MIRYSIVIPCYNEADTIPLVLERFQEVLESRDDVEVILVNSGSTDATPDVLAACVPRYPFVRAVNMEINQGYGHGILSGLQIAQGDYLGWTHADMQTDPGDVLHAIACIKARSQTPLFVKGRRRGRPLWDNLFTLSMSLFESLLMETWLWDINAQPTLFHRSLLKKWKSPPYDFAFDLYALYQAKQANIPIIRVDVRLSPRRHGQSRWKADLRSKYRYIRRTLAFSWALKKDLNRRAANDYYID